MNDEGNKILESITVEASYFVQTMVSNFEEIMTSSVAASWTSAIATFFAAIIALYLGLSGRKPRVNVTYKYLHRDNKDAHPNQLGLFVSNVGYQPAYIVGYGYQANIKCPGCASEYRDGKIDRLEPFSGGEVPIALPPATINYICSGLSRGLLYGWMLRRGILKNIVARHIAKNLRFFIITSDSKKHFMKEKPIALINMLKDDLIAYVKEIPADQGSQYPEF